ncbi:MAG: phosphoribosylformylglycinamidine cyclo-ligase [Ruminococcus sp.]|jgi:phosphoribosylformylglycinamidine cyclo-ligase|nr:phosphoribosylformylglycinamidine cyclo-ligase [Ruminococcus sp.]
MNSFSDSYKEAGVDITAGYKSTELIKKHVARTSIPGVLTDIGGFGGLFAPDFAGMEEPVLVSGTDGVGTKLKAAFLTDRHNTIGIDAVAMCVNDIICAGAKPLFFLDYIACGKNIPTKIEQIVKGVADGCEMSGCALIGGETAEMPDFYPEDEYDIAGFAVGIVDKKKIITTEEQKPGDVLIALKSSGLHSNGFSLVRKVFALNHQNISRHYSEIGQNLGDALLTPTMIYVKPVLDVISKVKVKGIANITGGGFFENIPRAIKDGLCANIDIKNVQTLPIFDLIMETGNIPLRDMYNTFNMGVGMVMAVSPEDAVMTVKLLANNGVESYFIGELTEGDEKIVIKGL